MLILLPQLFLNSPPPPYPPNSMSSTLPFQTTNKTTKERQQNKKQTIKYKIKQKTKSPQKMESVLYYQMILGHGVWLIWYTQWQSLEEIDFPFARRDQRQTTTWLGVGFYVHFFAMLRSCLVWTCAGLVYDVIVSMSSNVHQFCCVWKMLAPWHNLSSWLLKTFYFLFCTNSWMLRGDVCWRQSMSDWVF